MMPKLTILATLPFVFLAQGAGAAPLARCVGSGQRLGAFPLTMNWIETSVASTADELEPNDWSVFAWAFEPGDGAKLDYSILSFRHADDSTFAANYSILSFRHADDSTFVTNNRSWRFYHVDDARFAADYPISSLRRVYYSAFATPEFFALDARTASSLASEGLDAALTAIDEVQPELTPLTGDGAAKALSRAWKRAKRQMPGLDLVVVLTAHWAHETASGTAMFNHNFGGIKGRGPTGLSCLRGAREGFGFRTRAIRDRFRAYPNVASGADDYLSLLLRKYPTAIDAAERGEVSEFVHTLHDGGYFTGSEQDYELALLKHTIRAQEWALSALGGIRPIEIPSLTALTDPTAIP
jgi:hypothetical protein